MPIKFITSPPRKSSREFTLPYLRISNTSFKLRLNNLIAFCWGILMFKEQWQFSLQERQFCDRWTCSLFSLFIIITITTTITIIFLCEIRYSDYSIRHFTAYTLLCLPQVNFLFCSVNHLCNWMFTTRFSCLYWITFCLCFSKYSKDAVNIKIKLLRPSKDCMVYLLPI